MTFDELREKARLLPPSPGVYIHRDAAGEIIYIGKAKVLKNRVLSYFSGGEQSLKTMQLVSRIADFDTIFVSTEFDALLLESTLIKKHKPKYNILLKDDKGYPFLCLPDKEYPRFELAMKKTPGKARFFGPFGSRGWANSAISLINEVFALPSCSRVFPRDIGRERPCLMLHLKKCCGVCSGAVSKEQYDELLGQAVLLLDGKTNALERMLEQSMQSAAENELFEKAAMYRDRLFAVKKLKTNRIVVGIAGAEVNALSFAVRGARACVTSLSYVGGSLLDKHFELFDGLGEKDAVPALESFIKQYYGAMLRAPKEILLSHEIDDADAIAEYLSSITGRKHRILAPKRGEKAKMVALSRENGELELLALESREQKTRKSMELLAESLGLEKPPERIEAFDISNTAGSDAVGSMTVFSGGKPLKKAYKRFKIKTAEGGDDYGSMAEVLSRRFDRAIAGDESFLPLPDVLLIDGGAGQVSVVKKVLDARALSIPIYGMVKDSKHRTRALVSGDGAEIGIQATPAVFSLIGRIQEETHRFAVEYHRELRSKSVRKSALDDIPGIGEARRKALLREFKSVDGISKAGESELARVVPKDVARAIAEYFAHKNGKP